MQTKVEHLEHQLRKVTMLVERKEVQDACENELREMAAKVEIPGGYTKLKAKISRMRITPAYRELVLERTVEAFLKQAGESMKELGFRTVGRPELDEITKLTSFDQELTMVFSVEELPRPETLKIAEVAFPAIEATAVTDEEVEQAVESELTRMTSYENMQDEHEIAPGDLALVQVELKNAEGQVVPSKEFAHFTLIAGQPERARHALAAEIAAKLPGMVLQQKATFAFDWAADAEGPEGLKGQKVGVEFSASFGRKAMRPQLTDAFAKEQLGHETVSAYKDGLRKALEESRARSERGAHFQKMLNALVEANPMPMATRLLERTVTEQIERLAEKGEQDPAQRRAEIEKDIAEQLRRELLLTVMVDELKIEPDHEAVAQQLEKYLAYIDRNDPKFEEHYMNTLGRLIDRDIQDKLYARLIELSQDKAEK